MQVFLVRYLCFTGLAYCYTSEVLRPCSGTACILLQTKRVQLFQTVVCVAAGKKMHITAGVIEAQLGCDLLLSCKEIAQFISDGFTFDIR